MPVRVRLTADRIVDAAAEVADGEGLDGVTVAGVAARLGVRGPSLYNHVDGLDDILRRLTVRSIDELGVALQTAAVGRSREDAVRAICLAFRRYASEHPGRYATTVPTSEVDDEEVRAAGARVVAVVLAALSGFELDETTAIHAARSLRAAVHGFVAIELAGGFGLSQSPDDSFDWLVALLAERLAHSPT